MSTQILEQFVRFQVAIAGLRDRATEEDGQTTVEWLVIMVGLTALAAALVATGVWDNVAKAIAQAVTDLINKTVGKAG